MSSCCPTSRTSVLDCFDAGRRRQRLPALDHQGSTVPAAGGLQAAFSYAVHGDRLIAIRFRASHCVTLVAYCERLCQLAEGRPLAEAQRLNARLLADKLTGVPLGKRSRAALAVAAFTTALRQHQAYQQIARDIPA